MTDPKNLDDDELKRRLRWAIMPTDQPATQDEKRFNVAALNEYIERKLTDT